MLATFLAFGIRHVNPANWSNFFPKGINGMLAGAATAVFPYVGFDALYTFARESKSLKDTRVGTYVCVGVVALLYVTVMAVATGLAPCFFTGPHGELVGNPLFVGSEAAAPLAKLLSNAGETWVSKFIAVGAVLGIFNVLLVLCMGGPRIFRNMAEDGLLPPIFKKTNKGNPTLGVLLNGIIVASIAGFVPFGQITDMMVLGTLIAFMFVGIGATRLKLVNPVIGIASAHRLRRAGVLPQPSRALGLLHKLPRRSDHLLQLRFQTQQTQTSQSVSAQCHRVIELSRFHTTKPAWAAAVVGADCIRPQH